MLDKRQSQDALHSICPHLEYVWRPSLLKPFNSSIFSVKLLRASFAAAKRLPRFKSSSLEFERILVHFRNSKNYIKKLAALPYSDPREICIESYFIRFVLARGFQIYMWNLALTHITAVMGVQSSENNRGDPYRFFDFFFTYDIYISLESSCWAESNGA